LRTQNSELRVSAQTRTTPRRSFPFLANATYEEVDRAKRETEGSFFFGQTKKPLRQTNSKKRVHAETAEEQKRRRERERCYVWVSRKSPWPCGEVRNANWYSVPGTRVLHFRSIPPILRII
jgi:hypothetical protein